MTDPRPVAAARRIARSLLRLVVAAGLTAGAAHAGERRKVVIDDDGFGLMQLMLLAAPDVEVLGLTTVSGNTWVNRVTAQALQGVEAAGRTDVPVVPGATFPLVNSEALTDRWEALYGKLVWKGAWMSAWVEPTRQSPPVHHGPDDPVVLPGTPPTTRPSSEIAANFLIRMVHTYPHEVTIVAAGPLTNLALAQRLDPAFATLAKALIYMGGSLGPQQRLATPAAADFAREYVNSPRREFNIRFDPEAASIVARSPWPQITVVPVDPATATELTPALRDRLAAGARPALAAYIAAMPTGFPLWDEVAAGVWLDPGLVTSHETLYVDYNTVFSAGYGDLLSWRAGYQPGLGEQPADVVRTVDVPGLEALIGKLLARP
jgi:inosine-uridine nucleoside N-ribohydrolase